LAYPQSGEGIRPAIESAMIAADVVLQANGDFSSSVLSKYERRMTQRFGVPKPHQFAPWLPAAWLQFLAAQLMRTHWFAKNVIVERWFLHNHQAALEIADR
jgi:flavin-dependent dehydrogenase